MCATLSHLETANILLRGSRLDLSTAEIFVRHSLSDDEETRLALQFAISLNILFAYHENCLLN